MAAGRKVQDVERQAAMAALYRGGQTLEQIGQAYGVTRERVRQIIGAAGLSRKDGGTHIKSIRRNERKRMARHAKRDKQMLEFYGCTYAEALTINDLAPISRVGSTAQLFARQRQTAKNRGIEWAITLPEWVAVWRDSGKWEARGRGRDGYCMARHGDTGPYAVGNVYITTIAENVRDYQSELKVRGVTCADGFKRLPEKSERVSARKPGGGPVRTGMGKGWVYLPHKSKSSPYQVMVGRKYVGVFATQELAEKAYREACASILRAA